MTATLAPDLAADQISRQRRADRIVAQSVLSRISTLRRVRGCRRTSVLPGGAVNVGATGHAASGDRRGSYMGLATCGSVWCCPECASVILVERQRELELAFEEWERRGQRIALATFTLRHTAADSLTDVWDAVSYAWSAARSGRGWFRDQQAYGVRRLTVCRDHKATGYAFGDLHAACGCCVSDRRIDWVRVVEVTVGGHGWHVHVHAALFVSADFDDRSARLLHASMFARWQAAVERRGFTALDINTMTLARARDNRHDVWDSNLAAYVTKGRYRSMAEIAAAETSRGDMKIAHLGNRTPFVLLAGLVDEVGRKGDRALWREWEHGSLGRRQFSWSRGLREDLLPGLVERTNEEIVADTEGVDAVVSIPREGWATILREGLRAAVLDAVECDDTGDMLRDCLDAWGVPWGAPVVTAAC